MFLKRLLVISLVAATVLVPAAAAGTITVATASSMTPSKGVNIGDPSEGVTIVRVFHSYPRALPRAIYVVTSGPRRFREHEDQLLRIRDQLLAGRDQGVIRGDPPHPA